MAEQALEAERLGAGLVFRRESLAPPLLGSLMLCEVDRFFWGRGKSTKNLLFMVGVSGSLRKARAKPVCYGAKIHVAPTLPLSP